MDVAVQMLGPVIALVAWSLVMWIWMYVARLPAIRASGMKLDPEAPRGTQMATLPPRVRWKADNFNHLMEQPQVFYAVAIALALLGVESPASAAGGPQRVPGAGQHDPDPVRAVRGVERAAVRADRDRGDRITEAVPTVERRVPT